MEIIVGKQNTLAYTFTVSGTNGVLVISGEQDWDIIMTDLRRVIDTTNSNAEFFLGAGTTFSGAFAAGLKTWTWNLTNLPAGSATNDTLVIYLGVNPQQAEISLLQYQKA